MSKWRLSLEGYGRYSHKRGTHEHVWNGSTTKVVICERRGGCASFMWFCIPWNFMKPHWDQTEMGGRWDILIVQTDKLTTKISLSQLWVSYKVKSFHLLMILRVLHIFITIQPDQTETTSLILSPLYSRHLHWYGINSKILLFISWLKYSPSNIFFTSHFLKEIIFFNLLSRQFSDFSPMLQCKKFKPNCDTSHLE